MLGEGRSTFETTPLVVRGSRNFWVNSSLYTVSRSGEDRFTVDDVGTKSKVGDYDIPPGGYEVFSGDNHQVEIHRTEKNNVSIVYIPHIQLQIDKPETEFVCSPGTVTILHLTKGVLGMSESQASSLRLLLKRDHYYIKANGDRSYLFNAGTQPDRINARFRLPGRGEYKGITYMFEKATGKDRVKMTMSGKPQ